MGTYNPNEHPLITVVTSSSPLGKKYPMPYEMPLEEREEAFRRLKPGTPLFILGHVMIYLGEDNDDFYIIHNFIVIYFYY